MIVMIIGITGVARSGKDTFYSILNKYLEEKQLKSQRLAFADDLKKELNDFTKEKFKIDLFKCDGPDKELVRPLMVAYGKCRRSQTEGKYWTSQLDIKVEKLLKEATIPIITDVRYIEYKDDEYAWLKSHNGILIHLSRKLDDGTLILPANIEEKANDNKLKTVADFSICWETCQDTNFLYELMQKNLRNIYDRLRPN
jgi:hypothetical protein